MIMHYLQAKFYFISFIYFYNSVFKDSTQKIQFIKIYIEGVMVIFVSFIWISSRFRTGYPTLDESLESFKTKRVHKYFFKIISINHNWQEDPNFVYRDFWNLYEVLTL